MMVPSPSPSGKAALRTVMRQRRRDYAASLAAETRIQLEADLALTLDGVLFAARAVAAYFPMTDEISCLPALERARAMGKVTALPFFADRDSRMTFRDGPAVDPGPWGILQPEPHAPMVAPDLLLIPLLVIDQRGNRIGMGKGHYDRALPGLREHGSKLIGIGWSFQLVGEPIEPDSWDVPLDAFASPNGVVEFTP